MPRSDVRAASRRFSVVLPSLALLAALFAGACQRDRAWPPGRLVSDWGVECTKSPPSLARSIEVDGCDRYLAVAAEDTIVVTRFPDLEPLACFQARGFRTEGATVDCRGDVFAYAWSESDPSLGRSALIMGSLRRRDAWLVDLQRRFPDVRSEAGFGPEKFVEGLGLVDGTGWVLPVDEGPDGLPIPFGPPRPFRSCEDCPKGFLDPISPVTRTQLDLDPGRIVEESWSTGQTTTLAEWPFAGASQFNDDARMSAVDGRTRKAVVVGTWARPGCRISGWQLEDWQSMRRDSGKVRGFSLQLPQDDDHRCEPILNWSVDGAALARNGTRLAVAGGLYCYDQYLEHSVLVCTLPSCAQPRRIPWGDRPNSHDSGWRTQWHLSADGRYLALLVFEDCGSTLCSHVEVWDLDAGVLTARYPAADPATAGPRSPTIAHP